MTFEETIKDYFGNDKNSIRLILTAKNKYCLDKLKVKDAYDNFKLRIKIEYGLTDSAKDVFTIFEKDLNFGDEK